jgi:hypothetical protein
MLNLTPPKFPPTGSDLVINYADLRREGRIRPGEPIQSASAGIGFKRGATLARA